MPKNPRANGWVTNESKILSFAGLRALSRLFDMTGCFLKNTFLAEMDVHPKYIDPRYASPQLFYRLGDIAKSKFLLFMSGYF